MIYVYLRDGTCQPVQATEVNLTPTRLVCRKGAAEVGQFERPEVLMFRRGRPLPYRWLGSDDAVEKPE
jgi:hypothetical protein